MQDSDDFWNWTAVNNNTNILYSTLLQVHTHLWSLIIDMVTDMQLYYPLLLSKIIPNNLFS